MPAWHSVKTAVGVTWGAGAALGLAACPDGHLQQGHWASVLCTQEAMPTEGPLPGAVVQPGLGKKGCRARRKEEGRCWVRCLASCRVPAGPLAALAGGSEGSPVLPVLAQQDADALVQRGPIGLVREEGQEVGPERGHLGAGLTFALGRKEAWWSLPEEQRKRPFPGGSSGRPSTQPAANSTDDTCAELNRLLGDGEHTRVEPQNQPRPARSRPGGWLQDSPGHRSSSH